MKVIKKGRLAGDEIYQGECYQCGTIVEFERGEARYVSDQRDGDSLVVDCPVCTKEIWTLAGGYGR